MYSIVKVGDIAEEMGVANETVYYWIRHGKLNAKLVPEFGKGKCLIDIGDYEQFRQSYISTQIERSNCGDTPAMVEACLNCEIPFECNPKSRYCNLRKVRYAQRAKANRV